MNELESLVDQLCNVGRSRIVPGKVHVLSMEEKGHSLTSAPKLKITTHLCLLEDARIALRSSARHRLCSGRHGPEAMVGIAFEHFDEDDFERVDDALVGVQDPRDELRQDSEPLWRTSRMHTLVKRSR